MVQPIPEGCASVGAFLIVKDARKAIEFYAKAFGAEQGCFLEGPGGSVMHSEVRIGNSTIMIGEENPQWQMVSAETMGGSPISMHLYVEDVDATFQQALDAGCTPVAPLMDAFWGDRYGKVADPFGYQWGIATHIEDVDEVEMKRRAAEWMSQMAGENAS